MDAGTPLTQLKGIGPALAEKLQRLGMDCIEDVLFHLPLRYQDRTRITPIAALRPGMDAVIEGVVAAADVVQGRRRSLICRLQDGSGTLSLRFFHFSAAQLANLQRGSRWRCYGEVRSGASGLEIYHPEMQRIEASLPRPVETSLTPIYPTTEGLSQLRLRSLADAALGWLEQGHLLPDLLPAELLPEAGMPDLHQALRWLHRPPPGTDVQAIESGQHPASRRLIFEELLAHQLAMLQLRNRLRRLQAPVLKAEGELHQRFIDNLGFALTDAQQRVGEEIRQDLQRNKPMLRLVQGDVGAGKTVVAALAALQAIEAGWQVALMAPTELLAEQHFDNFRRWLAALGISTAWLAGKLKGKIRDNQLQLIASGEAAMVVGTHALFQADVQFHKLGLVIIDEQHRFGVEQRLALRDKGSAGDCSPHQLIMTATPIPRTLAMSAYADLDTSILDQLPPGRTPVNTVLIGDSRRDEVIERVRAACGDGRQAYWVCTLIEDSEQLQAQAAEATWQTLCESLPELSIGLVHGRMKATEKATIMAAFKAGELHLLVATTVIEVGVDVPNASLMIIENPERLGLAQLHQLRGRVGRGSTASHCVLLYHAPLGQQSRERLNTMRETSDGFVIAERDLALRGPGEVLGTRQTGLVQFRIADLLRDADLLPAVQQAARQLTNHQPQTGRALVRRWLAHNPQFAQV
ncbi:ATP-dependent DNA helicase RecG [Halopseudomonas yangmingensis]|uniref:ATP-dependent DNA helicase RecG n=1 Tax=Halopseudomonas yangmingensis TaxID=1720063 RepID=A0A1I4QVT0_9GAMM|nr:ATP-dependent DNA helicase RecG [Halopseudomonas yangmingensis]SFM43915.1 ATP-dependent DNA helicase RecG [Halopseudomonas yangmingensis]